MEIIKAEEEHIPEMLDLWIEFMNHHEEMDHRFPMRPEARGNFETHLREQMGKDDVLVLTARDGDTTVGFVMANIASYPPIFTADKFGAVDTIGVTAESQRQGIGELLMKKIFEWFDSQGIKKVEISVAAGNTVGYPFWEKLGFQAYMHKLYLDR